jgi:hypothetical protein
LGLKQILERAWSGIQMGQRPLKALVLDCIERAWERGKASALGSTTQYSRLKTIQACKMENREYGYTIHW